MEAPSDRLLTAPNAIELLLLNGRINSQHFRELLSRQMLTVVDSGVQTVEAIISRPSSTFKLIIFVARIQAKGISSLSLASLSFFLGVRARLNSNKMTHMETTYNECAWPQQSWRSCANGCNIVMLCFSAQGRKENVESHGWLKDLTSFKRGTTTPSNTQQHATFYHPKNIAVGF